MILTEVPPEEHTSLPGFTDTHFHLYYGLSSDGRRFCDRLVSVVGYVYPEITYCPVLLPLVSLFLHYVQVWFIKILYFKNQNESRF